MIVTESRKFPCPICADGKGPARYDTGTLVNHLDGFHHREDAWSLAGLAVEIANKPRGWPVPLVVLTAIDPGFAGHEDEDTLTVSHDGEVVARYSRHAGMVDLIADARQHMAEHHGVRLPYSLPAASLGGV